MSTRNKYSKEFKEEAVKLLKTSGKTSLEISGDLGISRDNLLRWNREFETEERAGSTETINSEDFKEIKRLKYKFIMEQSYEFPVSRICQIMNVSKSGYYAWITTPKGSRALENEKIVEKIRYFHDANIGLKD